MNKGQSKQTPKAMLTTPLCLYIIIKLRQLPHEERLLVKNEIKNTLFRYQLQILDKQNAMQGNFNDQNVNNRNSFVSQLGYQLSLPLISSHGNSFPIQQSHNLNYNNFQSPENANYAFPAQSPSYAPVSYGDEANFEHL